MIRKSLSFQKKLYLSFMAVTFVLLFTCVLFFYSYAVRILKTNSKDSLSASASTLAQNLDNLLTNADSSLQELQTNSALFSIARKIPENSENYFSYHVKERNIYQSAFRSVLLAQNRNASISFVNKYNDFVANSNYLGLSNNKSRIHSAGDHSLLNQDTLTPIFEEIQYVLYLPPHKDYYSQDATVFSVVRSMRNTYRSYGLITMDFDISVMTELLKIFHTPEDYAISILDSSGHLVYADEKISDPEKLLKAYQDTGGGDDGCFSFEEASLSSAHTSALTGWTILLTCSTRNYLHSVRNLVTLAVLYFLVIFLIMATFLLLISRRLTFPLRRLTEQLKDLEPGQLLETEPVPEGDEVAALTNTVQRYLAEIYEKNQQLTESRHRTLMAHYSAMEAQLNPHFLYNTLSVIGMTGLSGGNITVSDMCGELANLLRYSLSYAGQAVRLEQEQTNGNRYLYLMKMRFEDDLIYEWDWDDSLNTLPVPKLILQPLIENCFHHGFRQKGQEVPPPWRIRIRSSRNETHWFLSVANNGLPFSEEKLAYLQEHFQQFRSVKSFEESTENFRQAQGYGLENTILRLNIYYSGQALFRVTSSPEEWTTITIGGPLARPSGDHFTDKI